MKSRNALRELAGKTGNSSVASFHPSQLRGVFVKKKKAHIFPPNCAFWKGPD